MRDWTRVKPHLPPFDGGWTIFDGGCFVGVYEDKNDARRVAMRHKIPAREIVPLSRALAASAWSEILSGREPQFARTPFGVCTPQELAAAERAAAARA